MRLPSQMQRAMAAEAEASREARAKVGCCAYSFPGQSLNVIQFKTVLGRLNHMAPRRLL